MKTGTFYLTLLFVLAATGAMAQLSPGELAAPHAKLEGITNCTQCHVMGEKVSNDKCLSCHTALKYRIDRGKGYHSSAEVRGKECASCHSDHHGRNFNMIRFDEKNFNHNAAGYELTGKHKRIDCRQCHVADFIQDPELKKNKKTFLGLGQECLRCHQDYHQNTLSNDCARCHTTEKFVPASNFNHSKTNYALLGKHKDVQCVQCHIEEKRNGKDFQRFSGIAFGNCNNCHVDAHKNNLGTNCKECHTEESFANFRGMGRFNHNHTQFPLKGKHKKVNCAECHKMDLGPLAIFQDRTGVHTDDCATCHLDKHEGRFGTNCKECHTEETFRVSRNLDNFDHNLTDYPLAGKHEAVDCRKCHTEKYTDPLPHNTCAGCHTDYHDNQFANTGMGAKPDCAACHVVDGFAGSTYPIEEHAKSRFPLEGAHAATPCFACHKREDKWRFRNIGEKCADCHDDVHAGQLNPKFYPDKTCENCHLTTSWQDSRFDHNLTNFKLLGAHTRQNCAACHVRDDEDHRHGNVRFANLATTCTGCHENVHDRQFEKNGVTDCVSCHAFEDWQPVNFNHDNTAFKLDGKHAKVECKACHKPVENNQKFIVQYKFETFECKDCHH